MKTPWVNTEMFGNIHKTLNKIFRKIDNNSKETLLHFTNLLSRRQRAFITDKNNLDAMKKIFEVKDAELVIDVAELVFPEKLADEMNKFKGEKIFFIMLGNYWQVGRFLLSKGFVEGNDFVNALMFLSERQGLRQPFGSRFLVQAM